MGKVGGQAALRGKKGGLELSIDAKAPYGDLRENIVKLFAAKRSFFNLEGVRVTVCGRTLAKAEKEDITKIIKTYAGESAGVLFEDELPKAPDDAPKNWKNGFAADGTTVVRESSLFVRGIVRSGQRIESEGSITVLGDVNAGAELIAAGNIVVLGALRGIAHAGARGDENAFVCALSLKPPQLRIAGEIAIVPNGAETGYVPEKATVRDGRIVIEPI